MGHRNPLISLYLILSLAAAPDYALASETTTGDKGTEWPST